MTLIIPERVFVVQSHVVDWFRLGLLDSWLPN